MFVWRSMQCSQHNLTEIDMCCNGVARVFFAPTTRRRCGHAAVMPRSCRGQALSDHIRAEPNRTSVHSRQSQGTRRMRERPPTSRVRRLKTFGKRGVLCFNIHDGPDRKYEKSLMGIVKRKRGSRRQSPCSGKRRLPATYLHLRSAPSSPESKLYGLIISPREDTALCKFDEQGGLG